MLAYANLFPNVSPVSVTETTRAPTGSCTLVPYTQSNFKISPLFHRVLATNTVLALITILFTFNNVVCGNLAAH